MLKNEINMNNSVLTPAVVIKAQVLAARTGKDPAYARAHSYAIAQWEYQALSYVISIHEAVLATDELPKVKDFPKTIGGLPLRRDDKLSPDRVIFHAEDGEQLAAITVLPIMSGFTLPEYTKDEGWLFE